MVTYHVKLGKEAEFEALLSRAWRIYRKERLVVDKPHLIFRSIEDGDKTRFVEIFTWLSHDGPEHAPDTVKSLWEEEQSLCEPRGGHRGIEGGEVEFVANK